MTMLRSMTMTQTEQTMVLLLVVVAVVDTWDVDQHNHLREVHIDT